MADFQEDDLEYLSPSFDPNTLTVPRLRSILVEHEVNYPSSAKKAQLIDLFNEHVLPLAKRLLSSRARTKRTTKGIADVPSSQDYDEPTETPRRRSRKAPPPDEIVSNKATPNRRSPTKAARQSMQEDETPATARRASSKRTRQSLASPTVVAEDVGLDGAREYDEDSPFTQDNPFQSGSSPPEESRRSTSVRKRRTLSPAEGRERPRKSTGRKSDQSNGSLRQSPTKVEMSVAKLKRESPDSDLSEPGEGFTPEEQLELELAQDDPDSRGRRVARRRKGQTSGLGSVVKTASFAVSLAMLGGLATVWRQEKLEVGYCGIGRPSANIAGVEVPDWADIARPQCEPCPPHAFCSEQLRTTCEPGFILQPHPLSLNGLVPLPPTCEPDGEKARKVKAVADRAIEELRERNAKWECGELKTDEGVRIPHVEVEEEVLKAEVSSKRRRGMSQEEFEDLWSDAIGEVRNRDEVISNTDGNPRLRSTSLARVPLACAIRRSLRLALVRHLWQLSGVILLLAAAAYLRMTVTSRRSDAVQARRLASAALDRLATQAARNLRSPGAVAEPWISIPQLRDDVLRSEFSASRRKRLWARVQALVEGNANVRSSVREGRSGDVGRVWEWIGATDVLEDGAGGAGSGGRKSGGAVKDEGGGDADVRRWDEGRPIY